MNFDIGTLIGNLNKEKFFFDLDLVLEGGCMNGAYEVGGLTLIKELEKLGHFKIDRISGASVGSYAGFLYLINKLELYTEYYEKMRDGFRDAAALNGLKDMLNKVCSEVDDECFKSLQDGKLFIVYYDVIAKSPILKSKYESREELAETILKSCHVPFLINGEAFYRTDSGCYMDGGMPHVFKPSRRKDKRTLYMKLTQLTRLQNILNVKGETTIHGRVLEGMLDTYNFFLKGHDTTMCSYVDHWNITHTIRYNTFDTAWWILIYMFYWMVAAYEAISPRLEKSATYHHFKPVLTTMYKEMVRYMVFM